MTSECKDTDVFMFQACGNEPRADYVVLCLMPCSLQSSYTHTQRQFLFGNSVTLEIQDHALMLYSVKQLGAKGKHFTKYLES